MTQNIQKNVVMQLGALITLYLSISFLLTLLFGIINIKFPDSLEGYWAIESAADGIRLGIAMLVVFFPTYLVLTHLVNEARRKDQGASYVSFTKWLIYLSLLLGGLVILSTLVTIIYQFLNGEITERFIYKATAVLLVVGAAVHYYVLDAKGFWLTHKSRSIMFGIGALLVVFAAVAFGITSIDSREEVRAHRADEQQIQDLQQIQWRVEDYINSQSKVPNDLNEVYKEEKQPAAPENRTAYIYEKTEDGFKLCANFAYEAKGEQFATMPTDPSRSLKNPDNWNHEAGDVCFVRIVKLSEKAE